MVAVKMDKIDELYAIVEKLKDIAFLQNLIIDELIENDNCLKDLDLRAESIRYFLAEENLNAIQEIQSLITADDFYQNIK